MSHRFGRWWVIAAGLSACARYVPRPLEPEASVAAFSARRLDDPLLRARLAADGASLDGDGWKPSDLALAAVYLRPEVAAAQAQWRAARAAEISAGARPRPDLAADIGRDLGSTDRESPWVASLRAVQTIELGGKRGARLALARARTARAEVALRQAAWSVARDARNAALAVLGDTELLADARIEGEHLARLQGRLADRFARGALSAADVVQVQSERQTSALDAIRAEGQLEQARATAARHVGVPFGALDSIRIVPDTALRCPDGATPDSIASAALRTRLDVGAALTEYAQAEAELRLEVARVFPDLQLGPGFEWDEGVTRWVLGLGLSAINFGQNRGPILEGEERRAAAVATFAETQQAVIADVTAALIFCSSATRALQATDSLLSSARRRVGLAAAAYERGETGRTEIELLELAAARALRERHAAERRVATAALEMQLAEGKWGLRDSRWPDPRVPLTQEENRR